MTEKAKKRLTPGAGLEWLQQAGGGGALQVHLRGIPESLARHKLGPPLLKVHLGRGKDHGAAQQRGCGGGGPGRGGVSGTGVKQRPSGERVAGEGRGGKGAGWGRAGAEYSSQCGTS